MSTSPELFDVIKGYDAWFDSPDGRILFANELAAVRMLWREEFRPALEIGVRVTLVGIHPVVRCFRAEISH